MLNTRKDNQMTLHWPGKKTICRVCEGRGFNWRGNEAIECRVCHGTGEVPIKPDTTLMASQG
jgi:DnaJ-class molecular chaperone